jgi:hypothetical protein
MRERPKQPHNPESEDQGSDEHISRREFLKALGAAGAASAFVAWGDDVYEYVSQSEGSSLRYEGELISHERKEVPAGKMAGWKVGGLYKLHLGLDTSLDFDEPKTVPETIEVDYKEQLGALWNEKRKRNKDLTQAAVETGHTLLDEYERMQPNAVSLEEYKEEIDRVTEDLHSRIDWESVQGYYGLSDQGSKLLEDIAADVGGQEMLAYALTELMPAADGKLNKQVFSHLLENAGREYVERIPAVYDGLTSFGPYQLTYGPLYDNDGEKRGASHMAEHVTGEVPDNINKLRGVDHHQVAYLLALNNIAQLINHLPADGVDLLEARWKEEMSGLVQFIAAAHNYPESDERMNGALQAGEYWIANDMEKDFVISADTKPRAYAEKTKKNYEALQIPRDSTKSNKGNNQSKT